MGVKTAAIIKYRFVHNQKRVFGAALGYVPALFEDENGGVLPALFTAEQVKEAIARAKSNPEDAPELSWWQRLARKVL